jgi:hypothetical protein
MYAWKCWRDSRFVSILFLVCQLGLLAFAWFGHGQDPPTQLTKHAWQAYEAQDWMRVQAILLYMFALATVGVPTNSFSLTRPVARWRMIWIGFGIALAEFAVGFTLSGLSAGVHVARILPRSFAVSPSVSPSVPAGLSLSLFSIIALLVLGYILAAGVARGVIVLTVLLLPRRKTIYWIPVIVLVFVYLYISTLQPDMVRHWSHWFPLLVPKIVASQGGVVTVQPHLRGDFLIRGALVLLLPFAAQKALEAREV